MPSLGITHNMSGIAVNRPIYSTYIGDTLVTYEYVTNVFNEYGDAPPTPTNAGNVFKIFGTEVGSGNQIVKLLRVSSLFCVFVSDVKPADWDGNNSNTLSICMRGESGSISLGSGCNIDGNGDFMVDRGAIGSGNFIVIYIKNIGNV